MGERRAVKRLYSPHLSKAPKSILLLVFLSSNGSHASPPDPRYAPTYPPSPLHHSRPHLQITIVYLRMHIPNMILHFILPGKPRATLIRASFRRAAVGPRPGNMFCCMALEIGRTAEGPLAVRAGMSSAGGCGWRPDGGRVHKRDERSCADKTGARRGHCKVGEQLGLSDEAGAM